MKVEVAEGDGVNRQPSEVGITFSSSPLLLDSRIFPLMANPFNRASFPSSHPCKVHLPRALPLLCALTGSKGQVRGMSYREDGENAAPPALSDFQQGGDPLMC